jgi:hypothetical protein
MISIVGVSYKRRNSHPISKKNSGGIYIMKKSLLIGGIASALVLSAVSYASTNNVTSTSAISSITSVSTTDLGGSPTWNPVKGTSGLIGTGNLFAIESPVGGDSANVLVSLYISNSKKLQYNYTTLNETIEVYKEGTTPGTFDVLVDQELMTLQKGYVTFNLDSGRKYQIKVLDGYYTNVDTNTADGDLAPKFVVTAEDL